ncbi:hypothetical protein CRUP_032972, partial [Coryphaenoides rupestris]
DHADTELLLSRANVDQNALQSYAREAADFSTGRRLPRLDFAMNQYGRADVAMFDFTCMYSAENAAMMVGHSRHARRPLLVTLVGDSLLEGAAPLDVLAARESLYRLLPQTTPENMSKNVARYTVDPATRYPNYNPLLVTAAQVKHLLHNREETEEEESEPVVCRSPPPRLLRQESFSHSDNQLLSWCQAQTQGYRGVAVGDLTTSWKSGLALDFDSLGASEVESNTRLAFDVAKCELGVAPLLTVEEMSLVAEPDSLSMSADFRSALLAPGSLLSRLGHSPSRKRIPKHKDTGGGNQDDQSAGQGVVVGGTASHSRKFVQMYTEGVSSMAEQITNQIQSQELAPPVTPAGSAGASGVCFFCGKRVYVMERLSAEGLFFHRSCFQCDHCGTMLRLSSYAWDSSGGRFYCLQHYDPQTGGPVARKRPALSISSASHRTSEGPPDLVVGCRRRGSVEPQRIHLANYRPLATTSATRADVGSSGCERAISGDA